MTERRESDEHLQNERGRHGRRALLVGAFRSIQPEGNDGPFGGQGGFVDTLAPAPYSLATGYLKVFSEADSEVAREWTIERLDLSQPLELDDESEAYAPDERDVERILASAPDLVGFSSYTWNEAAFRELSRALKRRHPDLRIVVGGRSTEGDVESLLRDSGIDAAVIGEGELPFRQLLRQNGDPRGIPGVASREGDRIEPGGPSRSVQHLDDIPSPFAAGILTPKTHGMMLEFGRGCRHACGYCTWNSDKHLRYFSPSRIGAEVQLAHARGHRHVTVNDSALNYDTNQLCATVDAIHRADPAGDVQFTYNLRHESLDPRQLDALARLPTHTVLIGVESFTPRAMRQSDRSPVEPDRLRERFAALSNAVRPPVASIILGMPGENAENFIRTLEILLSWTEPSGGKPPILSAVLVSLLQGYAGSKLWHRRDELGLRFESKGIPYLIESPDFPARDLAAAKAYLVRRMAEVHDRLKAAEAIVLMDAYGGIHPWLSRKGIEALLHPWRMGERSGAWTLSRISAARDMGQAALLRFAWQHGGDARVRITLRKPDAGPPGPWHTHRYDLAIEPVGSAGPPPHAIGELATVLRGALVQGERRDRNGPSR